MIAIKGMDMPKGCSVCSGLCKDVYPYICYRCDIEFTEVETNLIIDLPGLTSKKCKLVALPEENKGMSWEELVEKASKISDLVINNNNFAMKNYNIVFFKNGKMGAYYDNGYITFINDERILNFYQMYQIIKALIGDER